MPRERSLMSRSASTTRTAVFLTKSIGPALCESMGEYFLVLRAEFTTNIVEIRHQPETFYIDVDSERFRYTPDFLIIRSCGSYSYIEIKDQRELSKPETVKRLEAAKNYFAAKNEELLVLSDFDLTRNKTLLTNIKHLKRYRTRDTERLESHARAIKNLLPIKLEDLRKRLGQEDCLGLIANQIIWCDLSKKLSDACIVMQMGVEGYECIN